MHADITPLAPWSRANPLFQIISTTALHVTCLVSGGLAILWFVLRSNNELEQRRRE
jgi:hypothetical protein